jgi:protein involved in temperature-dependent protein secretion
MTDWKDAGEGLYLASGLRLFLIDGQDRAILDARGIEFEPAALEPEPVASLDERSAL